MAIITVLGAGMMGSAVCLPMVDRGHTVRLVGTHLDNAIIDQLKLDHTHPGLKLKLPATIQPFHYAEFAHAARDAEYFGVGVSSAGVQWAGEQLAPYARPDRPILMISKGLKKLESGRVGPAATPPAAEVSNLLSILPDVLRDALGAHSGVEPVAVGGPCIAGELARREETCVVFSGRDEKVSTEWAKLLRSDYYRIWTSEDVLGVEISAALKNAYAMAMAFGAGVHEARGGTPGSIALHNYEAAVFAQSAHEMQLIVGTLGGKSATAVGLPGVGDLHVTCNGGRTGRFGRWLGLGIGVEAAIARMEGATLECLEILAVMQEALPSLEARLGAGSLPLLQHMLDVALKDAKVAPPFAEFFRSDGPR